MEYHLELRKLDASVEDNKKLRWILDFMENLATDSLHILRLSISWGCWQKKSELGGTESGCNMLMENSWVGSDEEQKSIVIGGGI